MKQDIDIDEMIKGIDFNATAVTSTTCDRPVKPLTMETLLEARELLQQGYEPLKNTSEIKLNMRLLWGHKVFDRNFHAIVNTSI